MVDQLEDPDPMMLNAELQDDDMHQQHQQEDVHSQLAGSVQAQSQNGQR
jgi:hypothetical protein